MQGMTVLSLLVSDTKPIPVVETYMPKAKTGNLKDPGKIREKEDEHRQKWLDSVNTHPLFACPTKVIVRGAVLHPDGTFTSTTTHNWEVMIGTASLSKEFIDSFSVLPPTKIIVGPHPLSHTRLLTNACVRCGVPVPRALLPSIPRYNPWNEVCPPSEMDDISYSTRARLLALPEDDILLASVKLAALQGAYHLFTKED